MVGVVLPVDTAAADLKHARALSSASPAHVRTGQTTLIAPILIGPMQTVRVPVAKALHAGLHRATRTTTSHPTRSMISLQALTMGMKVDPNQARRKAAIHRTPTVRVASVVAGVVAVAAGRVDRAADQMQVVRTLVVRAVKVVAAVRQLPDLKVRAEAFIPPFTRSSPSVAAFGTLARSLAVAAFNRWDDLF
jgi:hypothetical protein